MENLRKFEYVKRIQERIDAGEVFDLIPARSTKTSAGYDFKSAEDVLIAPNTMELVKTGIKARMNEDNYLELCNRSSNPKKKGIVLMNGVGVVDSDYYSNEDNDGEIGFMFMNITTQPVHIARGDKLGQGIFHRFDITADDSLEIGNERQGGFGSTGN